jgi:hypothetical protein
MRSRIRGFVMFLAVALVVGMGAMAVWVSVQAAHDPNQVGSFEAQYVSPAPNPNDAQADFAGKATQPTELILRFENDSISVKHDWIDRVEYAPELHSKSGLTFRAALMVNGQIRIFFEIAGPNSLDCFVVRDIAWPGKPYQSADQSKVTCHPSDG